MMEDYRLFVQRIGLVGIAQTYTNMKGLFLLPLFTKNLSTSEYGVWTLILITISVLQPFILLSLQDAILRFLSAQKKERIIQGVLTVVIVVICAGTIISTLFFFSSDYIANTILKEPSASYLFKIVTPFIIIDSINTIILSSFRIFGMIKNYAAVLILKTTLEIGLLVFFILSGFGLTGAILSLIITGVVSLIIMLILLFSYAGFTKPDFLLVRPYLLFSIPLIPITLAQFVIEISDRYVIGYFMDTGSVGIYSAAYGIGVIPIVLSTYLVYMLKPTIFTFYDTGMVEKARTYLSYSWKYLIMLSVPSVFGLTILARPLLMNMTTANYVSEGVYIIPLVAIGIVLWGMEQILAVSLLIFKRRKIFVIAFICGALTNFLLNILLIPHYGIIAAAVTTLTAYVIITIIIGYSSRKHFAFNLNLLFIFKSILAAIGMSLCIWIINPHTILGIVLSILLGILVYFCLLLLLKGFSRAELRTIFDLLKMKKLYEKIETSFDKIKK
jgi:O-antigen/teichoic acid export membrane protein